MTTPAPYPTPTARRLRIYSFDPALAARYDLVATSCVTIEIPWEDDLQPGPIDEYLEVVDVDPDSGVVYGPVDLNNPALLATDGLPPSESDPRFHQQMVYAVARKTIQQFERALGRKALWSTHRDESGTRYAENYVPRLRIYPHAMRQQNAFYSPQKKALLFGYFPEKINTGGIASGSMIFTCLSHDIIAHETTHALLDGVHPRFNEPVNQDVLAFHEAFADIVALFMHFTYPGVLRDQIARTRGDLLRDSLLGKLAQQFAQASGRGDALRSYLGGKDSFGQWRPTKPDPTRLGLSLEPHDRGAILVAAVFGAFMKVYTARTRDLFRIASEGTGVMREGDIHPDLVGRLADEAQRCADRTLQMAIRAIDYCPPVGITFGDYLRAIVTSDFDMNIRDTDSWRIAFIESFREWGIFPVGICSMAEDSLLWPRRVEVVAEQVTKMTSTPQMQMSVRDDFEKANLRSRNAVKKLFQGGVRKIDEDYQKKAARYSPNPSEEAFQNSIIPLGLMLDRRTTWQQAERQAALFHGWLLDESNDFLADQLGIVVTEADVPNTVKTRRGRPIVEVHSVRTVMRRNALDWAEKHLVAVITQRRGGYFDKKKQLEMDATPDAWKDPNVDFKYRAGCTLLIDSERMEINRIMRTPGTVIDDYELDRMRDYLLKGLEPLNAFDGVSPRFNATAEPFAFLHAHSFGA
jgi:hypothetical protein